MRLVEPRREARRVEQPPEVVARVREVRVRRGGDAAGVDPDEDDPQARAEDVRDGATQRRLGRPPARRCAPRNHGAVLAADREVVARPARLDLDDRHRRLPAAVATGEHSVSVSERRRRTPELGSRGSGSRTAETGRGGIVPLRTPPARADLPDAHQAAASPVHTIASPLEWIRCERTAVAVDSRQDGRERHRADLEVSRSSFRTITRHARPRGAASPRYPLDRRRGAPVRRWGGRWPRRLRHRPGPRAVLRARGRRHSSTAPAARRYPTRSSMRSPTTCAARTRTSEVRSGEPAQRRTRRGGSRSAASFLWLRPGRDDLRREHDDAQLRALAYRRPHADCRRRDRRDAARPRRQRLAVARARARPRARSSASSTSPTTRRSTSPTSSGS